MATRGLRCGRALPPSRARPTTGSGLLFRDGGEDRAEGDVIGGGAVGVLELLETCAWRRLPNARGRRSVRDAACCDAQRPHRDRLADVHAAGAHQERDVGTVIHDKAHGYAEADLASTTNRRASAREASNSSRAVACLLRYCRSSTPDSARSRAKRSSDVLSKPASIMA